MARWSMWLFLSALGRQYSRRKRQDLERRVRIVNESKAEILVSIHVNSMVSARWSGAQDIQEALRSSWKLAWAIFAGILRHGQR